MRVARGSASWLSSHGRGDKERLVELLQAMKQKALSAAVADPLRTSPRDSPAVSLSGKVLREHFMQRWAR